MDFFRNKRLWIVLAIMLLLGGLSLWYLNSESEEAAVRRTLQTLCRISSKAEGESAAIGALKINGTDKIFAPQCTIDFRHEMLGGTFTPTEITGTLARAHRMFRYCKVDMRDLSVTIENPKQASAIFTGLFEGVLNDGKRVNEVRELYCKLEKPEDRWLIREISVRNVLEK